MTRFLKYALVWFLALALPVQGFAAATVLCCGLSQQRSVISQSHHANAEVAEMLAVGVDHAEMTLPSVSDHHRAGTAAITGENHHAPDAKTVTKGKCSACAACCLGVAVVPEIRSEMPTPEPPGLTVASFYPSEFTVHIPGTPQRPPSPALL